MVKTVDSAQTAKRSLLRYAGLLAAMCVVLQIIIALRGSHIDVTSQLLVGIIAVYYAWYHYREKKILTRVRFGRLVAHMVGFLIINLSYHIHAFYLTVSNNVAIRGDEHFWVDSGWFGVLFGMSVFWGLGLIVHTVASVANRGFEELPRE